MIIHHPTAWVRVFAAIPPLFLLSGILTIWYAFEVNTALSLLFAAPVVNSIEHTLTPGGKAVIVLAGLLVNAVCVPLLLAFYRTVFSPAGYVSASWLRDHEGEAKVFSAARTIRDLTAEYFETKNRILAAAGGGGGGGGDGAQLEAPSTGNTPLTSSAYSQGGIRMVDGRKQVPAQLRGHFGSQPSGSSNHNSNGNGFNHAADDGSFSDNEEDFDGRTSGNNASAVSERASIIAPTNDAPLQQVQLNSASNRTDGSDALAANGDAEVVPLPWRLSACTSMAQLNSLYGSKVQAARSHLPLLTSLGHSQIVIDGMLSGRWQPGPHDMRWCKKCSALKPPRAHHCTMCGRCILKMDHHCPWTGNCIGYANYQQFLLILFWGLVATLIVTAAWSPILFSWWQPLQPNYDAVITTLNNGPSPLGPRPHRPGSGGGGGISARLLHAIVGSSLRGGRRAAALNDGDSGGGAVPDEMTVTGIVIANAPYTFTGGGTGQVRPHEHLLAIYSMSLSSAPNRVAVPLQSCPNMRDPLPSSLGLLQVLAFSICATFVLSLALFVSMHAWLVTSGKTTLEHSIGSDDDDGAPNPYNFGRRRNLFLVFGHCRGPLGWMRWLWPSGVPREVDQSTAGGTDWRGDATMASSNSATGAGDGADHDNVDDNDVETADDGDAGSPLPPTDGSGTPPTEAFAPQGRQHRMHGRTATTNSAASAVASQSAPGHSGLPWAGKRITTRYVASKR